MQQFILQMFLDKWQPTYSESINFTLSNVIVVQCIHNINKLSVTLFQLQVHSAHGEVLHFRVFQSLVPSFSARGEDLQFVSSFNR